MTVELTWALGLGVTITAALGSILWHHLDKRLDLLDEHMDSIRKDNDELRAEVYRDFMRRSELEQMRADLSGVYMRLNEISDKLNHMIGEVRTRADD